MCKTDSNQTEIKQNTPQNLEMTQLSWYLCMCLQNMTFLFFSSFFFKPYNAEMDAWDND